MDKGKALVAEGIGDKEVFTLVKTHNKGRGQKRSFRDRQEEEVFNQFDDLEAMAHEEGIAVDLQSRVKPTGMDEDGACRR